MDVTHNGVFLHHIHPNAFIDSPEFKLSQLSERDQSLTKQTTASEMTAGKTCSNCKQVLVEIEADTSIKRPTSATSNRSTNLLMNKSESKTRTYSSKKHRKNCSVKPHQINDRSKKEIRGDILFIDSPTKEKLGFPSANKLNKLAQVTITASENCKLLCWKRNLLVEETLANNPRLKTIFDNLIGRDLVQKLCCVHEEQQKKQQQIIGELQSDSQKCPITPCTIGKLLAHNPLKGDNLLSKLREANLLNAYPYIPHESLFYLNPSMNQYNRNLNIGLTGVLSQDLMTKPLLPTSRIDPYLNYHHPLLHGQTAELVQPGERPATATQQSRKSIVKVSSGDRGDGNV